MRLGIFGGAFDPIHYGHLLLAESCREQCGLDQVWFLPADSPPHKQHLQLTPAKFRLEMLELALAGNPSLAVSQIEIDRGGVSYTVQTLEQIHADRPDDQLFFLMGADSLQDLTHWRQPARICELAIPVAVRRPHAPTPDVQVLAGVVSPQRLEEIARRQVVSPLIGLSSSELRQRVAAKRSIRYWTPRAVEKYIETHGLYQGAGDPPSEVG